MGRRYHPNVAQQRTLWFSSSSFFRHVAAFPKGNNDAMQHLPTQLPNPISMSLPVVGKSYWVPHLARSSRGSDRRWMNRRFSGPALLWTSGLKLVAAWLAGNVMTLQDVNKTIALVGQLTAAIVTTAPAHEEGAIYRYQHLFAALGQSSRCRARHFLLPSA